MYTANRLFAACAAGVMLLTTPAAQAHVVDVAWKLTDTNLVVVASFNNDLPADDAEVTLHGSDDSVVATGRTDDTGTWKGPKPPPGSYRLTVKAMANHSQTIPRSTSPTPPGRSSHECRPQRGAVGSRRPPWQRQSR